MVIIIAPQNGIATPFCKIFCFLFIFFFPVFKFILIDALQSVTYFQSFLFEILFFLFLWLINFEVVISCNST